MLKKNEISKSDDIIDFQRPFLRERQSGAKKDDANNWSKTRTKNPGTERKRRKNEMNEKKKAKEKKRKT